MESVPCGSGDSEVDKSKIVRGIVTAGGVIFSIVLSAFGINSINSINSINRDDRRDGSQEDSGQEDSYPEELFEKYKYK